MKVLCMKPFSWNGRDWKPGDEVEIDEVNYKRFESYGYLEAGELTTEVPADWPGTVTEEETVSEETVDAIGTSEDVEPEDDGSCAEEPAPEPKPGNPKRSRRSRRGRGKK